MAPGSARRGRVSLADAESEVIEALVEQGTAEIGKGLAVDLLRVGITPGAIIAEAWDAAAARGGDLKYAARRIADARWRCEAAARPVWALSVASDKGRYKR